MAYVRLDREVREEIRCLLAVDRELSWSEIGRRVGFHRSTIQREVVSNGGRRDYRAFAGHQRATRLARRCRFKFDSDPKLAAKVKESLEEGYAPAAVARIHGGVCAETIYRAVYEGRLDVKADEVLRYRHRKRRHRWHRQPRNDGNYLGNYTPISVRPHTVNNRLEVGHWEGDLITGTKNQSAIITLTERVSRFQVALELPQGHTADATMERLCDWIENHSGLFVSLTWDRGAELARWERLTDTFGIAVYFCDPKSPWQRASNENANRQLRFWFPRRTDLSIYTQADLDRACHILNTTPRRIHNWATATDIYHQPRTRE